MSLTFHPPPPITIPPPLDAAAAELAVAAAFTPFPATPPAQVLLVSQGDLAMMLMSDSRWFFSPMAGYGWICSATQVSPADVIEVRSNFIDLPRHFKGVVSQIVAVAAAHCASSWNGFEFFATTDQIEDLCLAIGLFPIFVKLWTGDGPDYVAINVVTSTTILLECKGVSVSMPAKPKDFLKHKVQSVNGDAVALHAHILSYTYLSAGEALTTRWFNNRPPREMVARPQHVLVIAMQQFINQLRNAGHSDWAQRLSDALHGAVDLVVPAVTLRLLGNAPFDIRDGFFLSKLNRPITIAVRRHALDLFFGIAASRGWIDDDQIAGEFVAKLRLLSETREDFRDMLSTAEGVVAVLSISATGVAIVTVC